MVKTEKETLSGVKKVSEIEYHFRDQLHFNYKGWIWF